MSLYATSDLQRDASRDTDIHSQIAPVAAHKIRKKESPTVESHARMSRGDGPGY